MSLVIELERNGTKAGRVCDRTYRKGPGCPLILRQTSEDVLTGNVFGILRRIRPSLWLRPFLNHAFRTKHFRSCSLAGLNISFWTRVTPPASRARIEGFTEVDVMIRCRDLVVFVEAKYRAPLSTGTEHDGSRDQVIRLLDVAFEMTMAGQFYTRRPYVLVLGSAPTEPDLVSRYRDADTVAEALATRRRFPEHRQIAQLLARRIGYATWSDLAKIVGGRLSAARPTERLFLLDVVDYIGLKMSTLKLGPGLQRQMLLRVVGGQGREPPARYER